MAAPIGPGEVWREIANTHGDYQVSTLGRVRRTRAMHSGQYPAWGIVRCRPNNHGYPMFNTVCRGKRINKALHKIVIETFVGPPIPGFHAAHLSGEKTDARLENLKYVSPAANAFHKVAHGTAPRGERGPMAKLTDAQVREIRSSHERNVDIARRLGLNRHHVSDIRRGAVWRHLDCSSLSGPRIPRLGTIRRQILDLLPATNSEIGTALTMHCGEVARTLRVLRQRGLALNAAKPGAGNKALYVLTPAVAQALKAPPARVRQAEDA